MAVQPALSLSINSFVYVGQNDKSMTSSALSTARHVNLILCQPHTLRGCLIDVMNLTSLISILRHSGQCFGNVTLYLMISKVYVKENILKIYIYLLSTIRYITFFKVILIFSKDHDNSAQITFFVMKN